MTLATHEEVIEPEIVRTHTEWAEVIKEHQSAVQYHEAKAVEHIVLIGKSLTAAKSDVKHKEWMPLLEETGISRSDAQRYMAIWRRFSNYPNLGNLPTSPTALIELSRLDPSDIEEGIESGAITPNMKIKDAKAFARSEWPVVPEPTPEELFQRLEKVRAQNIADGISNPPRTREDREADGRAFVESLIGNAKRQAEPVTPEDKFAKALNAVGAVIRVNHGVNEAALNEDGWNVLRALGLR